VKEKVVVAINHRRNRQLYQGQVRSQLEQMGALGAAVNPYGFPPEDDTEKPGLSKRNSVEPLWQQLDSLLVVPQAVKEAWAADLLRR
jgi:hypothetical protein